MVRIGSRLDGIDDRWRYALLGASVSVPFTLLGYWQSGSEMSLGAVLLGGVVAGFLAKRATGRTDGVGVRTGVLGALPVVWPAFSLLSSTAALSGPAWFVTAGAGLAAAVAGLATAFAVALSAFLGAVGARIGGWLSGADGRDGTAA